MIKGIILLLFILIATQEHIINETQNLIKIFQDEGFTLAHSRIIETSFRETNLQLIILESTLYIRDGDISKKFKEYVNQYKERINHESQPTLEIQTLGILLHTLWDLQKKIPIYYGPLKCKDRNCVSQVYRFNINGDAPLSNYLLTLHERIKILEEKCSTNIYKEDKINESMNLLEEKLKDKENIVKKLLNKEKKKQKFK
jgi:hypothetical protein